MTSRHIWGLVEQGADREVPELIHDPPVNSPYFIACPLVAALSRSRATCPESSFDELHPVHPNTHTGARDHWLDR